MATGSSTKTAPAGDPELVYRVDDHPRSVRDWVLYSFQWVVTMFYAVVWGYAIVGIGMGFQGAELTRYMTAVVLMIGLGTLIQAAFGHRFAMVSGPNIIPSLAILSALTVGGVAYARASFTAQAIAGVVILVLGITGALNLIRRFWSPLILGAMVMTVGLAIAGVGLGLLTQDGFGWTFWVGALLALGGSVLSIRAKGVWSTLAPLLVIGLGYVAFMVFGRFDWSLVTDPPGFVLPAFFPYGTAMPPLDLIVIMIIVNLMAALNLYGNLTGYAAVVGEQVDARKARRSFSILGGVETSVAGVLGVPATVAYGENLGIVMLTRVAARAFIVVASVVFVVLAFIGPMGGLMAAMPQPVAGAVLLGLASTVIGIGAHVMSTAPRFDRREQTLVGFSVFLALGLSLLPDQVWEGVPRLASTVFSNPVIAVIIFVMVLERLVFRLPSAEAEASAPPGAPDEDPGHPKAPAVKEEVIG